MKALADTYKYKYEQALTRCRQYGLTFVNQGTKGNKRFLIKNRYSNQHYVEFDCIDKAMKLTARYKAIGLKYKQFFDKVQEYGSQNAVVKFSFDNVTITWANNKWFVKHKGASAQGMGTKRLAELGYLQHLVEQNIKGQIESKTVLIDLKEEGYKPVSNVKRGYYINKYGDVIRETQTGYKYCNVRREFRAKDDNNSYVSIDIDKEINKLFWS